MFYSPQSLRERREVILFKTRIRGGHTPHDARDAMGRHHINETGNIAASQRQLSHTNAAYSIQYARVADQELVEALNDR